MAGSIFICYRREDSVAYAGRLHDRLSSHFGKNRVFMDLDTIQPGEDFVDVLEGRVANSDVLIALIGKDWLDCKNAQGDRRLDDADDYVRREIAAALARKIRVIPALVGGAHMPSADRLPTDISALSRRNAIEVSDASFNASVAKLVEALEGAIEAERQRKETERRQARPAAGAQSAAPAEPVSPELPLDESTADRESVASSAMLKRRLLYVFAAFCVLVGGTYLTRKASTNDRGTVPPRAETTVPPPVIEPAGSGNQPAATVPSQQPEPSSPTTRVPAERRASSEGQRHAPAVATRSPMPAAASPVRIGGAIKQPAKLVNVQPVYPPIAQSARVQGVVIVELTIDTDGHVADAKVLRSIPLLDAAALDAVRQWIFAPTTSNGARVPVIMTVTVNFKLESTREVVVSYINRLEAAADVSGAALILRTVFDVTSGGTNATSVFTDLRQKVSTASEQQLSQIEKTIPR